MHLLCTNWIFLNILGTCILLVSVQNGTSPAKITNIMHKLYLSSTKCTHLKQTVFILKTVHLWYKNHIHLSQLALTLYKSPALLQKLNICMHSVSAQIELLYKMHCLCTNFITQMLLLCINCYYLFTIYACCTISL